ncbi:DUF4270 domain-containing protein [Flavivirga eckloniae]|uniref:DUF4270 domain-containing protein n=1 Tax=Flavivirga eckloniae TaxID=1803846 RepID=A0A2K9PQ33_9FLAO|nr:DUF4270 domain-containing protein [Flavivirga eckloniae]AUP79159.1 hypothetical protein C1H87_10780 [Flavivirga eckloniae]
MKKTIKAFKFSIAFLLVASSFIACDKDFSVIESSVLGSGNTNFGTDKLSLPIVAYNKKLDSLQINNGFDSYLLGFFEDQEFGQTTASIITQINPLSSGFSPDFGENPVIDSVIMSIPYSTKSIVNNEGNTTYTIDSLYGNPADSIRLTIYRNNYFLRRFNPNSNNSLQKYFSNANGDGVKPTDNSALINDDVINFDTHAGSIIFDDTLVFSNKEIKTTTGEGEDAVTQGSAPALRVHLDKDFWTSTIINKANDAGLSNLNNFLDYFRGLYLKAQPVEGKGSMILLNLNAGNANITIHYSKGPDDNRTQAQYPLFLRNGANSVSLNTFINNYNASLVNGNKETGDETLYLKGIEGSMAVVDLFGNEDLDDNDIPDALEDFRDEFRVSDGNGGYLKDNTTGNYILRRLINEAQLIIHTDKDYNKYDRIYAYDVKNSAVTSDYFNDPTGPDQTTPSNNIDNLNSRFISLGFRDDDLKFKIRLTEHLSTMLLTDSTNTKIGLTLSTNVNIANNAEILNSGDDVTNVPTTAVLAPRGIVLHGTNTSNEKGMKLEVFYTESEN